MRLAIIVEPFNAISICSVICPLQLHRPPVDCNVGSAWSQKSDNHGFYKRSPDIWQEKGEQVLKAA
jgi:hypothetical protein